MQQLDSKLPSGNFRPEIPLINSGNFFKSDAYTLYMKETVNQENTCGKFTSHSLNMTDRKRIVLTGIGKAESSNASEIVAMSCLGRLVITGSELKIDKYDAADGNMVITGLVDSIKYAQNKPPLLKRIFK